ncbi:ankyrin repeat domain-containing protein [Mycolicibacterium sp. Dal123E01]|uniref:ankyrin repeat domain-containing protein n=1 Tax=Mycolicibacterium sp. Dal123E01 TaxID=3457578 RepID=UPI00403EEA46
MNVSDRDRAGRTPLHYAVGDSPVGLDHTAALDNPTLQAENREKTNEYILANTRRLLAGGADPNAMDDEGFTPLHFAAQFDCVEVIRLLLDAGATVDVASRNGTTPVHKALRNTTGESEAILEILMEAGGDPTIEMWNGSSALKFAKRMQRADALEIFAKHGYE